MSEDIQLKQPADLEHTDKDLVDKNILGAMVLDTIKESYPGIKKKKKTSKKTNTRRRGRRHKNWKINRQRKRSNFCCFWPNDSWVD